MEGGRGQEGVAGGREAGAREGRGGQSEEFSCVYAFSLEFCHGKIFLKICQMAGGRVARLVVAVWLSSMTRVVGESCQTGSVCSGPHQQDPTATGGSHSCGGTEYCCQPCPNGELPLIGFTRSGPGCAESCECVPFLPSGTLVSSAVCW